MKYWVILAIITNDFKRSSRFCPKDLGAKDECGKLQGRLNDTSKNWHNAS
ncbi:MAG: hypothetical protein ACJAS4_002801 [Bacteriovoracaceae bacterium]|jgi:hypothetical protein